MVWYARRFHIQDCVSLLLGWLAAIRALFADSDGMELFLICAFFCSVAAVYGINVGLTLLPVVVFGGLFVLLVLWWARFTSPASTEVLSLSFGLFTAFHPVTFSATSRTYIIICRTLTWFVIGATVLTCVNRVVGNKSRAICSVLASKVCRRTHARGTAGGHTPPSTKALGS